jgi:glyoxylase-like metal-dependent hydrolase (beta-lactamase superfamily II)
VLITGDAVLTVDLNSLLGVLTGRQGVFGPPRYSTWDWTAAQRSIAAIAALEPRILATGHGPVRVEEAAQALQALAGGQRLPARWRQGLFSGVDYSARTHPLSATAPALPAGAKAAWSVLDRSRNRAKAGGGAGSSGSTFGGDPP